MLELRGKYNTAKVFTDKVEPAAVSQIINLLNQSFIAGATVRIMPDTHAGSSCTVGTTLTIADKVVPDLVGVDIGCGMETVILKNTHIEPGQLDKVIHRLVPAGHSVCEKEHELMREFDLDKLRCVKIINTKRARLSLGTLGGGNHFIELDQDSEGQYYLVIHSGSRMLGKQVAEHYRREGLKYHKAKRAAGEKPEKGDRMSSQLAWLEGSLMEDYLHDMVLAQRYADLNRRAIARTIAAEMKFKIAESFTTVHNYIDLRTMILRKGAISAKEGERVLIPLNMRDGSLIGIGLGNPDWNYSAPHGAGRLMSRSEARESLSVKLFQKTMEGIYSTTVGAGTLDESPFAYKPMEEITENIGESVKITQVIKPVYNFKSGETKKS
jgi:RNA-splicing ligase RtcB